MMSFEQTHRLSSPLKITLHDENNFLRCNRVRLERSVHNQRAFFRVYETIFIETIFIETTDFQSFLFKEKSMIF